MVDVNQLLAKIGADAPGNLKIYPANSRVHVFVKADKLPGQPANDFSFDLPGDSDVMIAQGLNYLINLLKGLQGNATPEPLPPA